MWPFSRRYPDVRDMPRDCWKISEDVYKGGPLIVRKNIWARKLVGHPDYPIRHQVEVALTTEEGAPAPPTAAQLRAVETMIVATFCTNEEAVLVAHITSVVREEYYFYTRSAPPLQARVNSIRAKCPGLAIKGGYAADPKWTLFKHLLRKL